MTVKTTGYEFKQFYSDSAYWGTYAWEEYEIEVDGKLFDGSDQDIEDIPYTAIVKIIAGYVYNQDPSDGSDSQSLESFFKKWKKPRNTMSLTIELAKEREAEFKELMKLHKFKVV